MCARISEKYQVDLRFTHTYSNSDDLKGSFAMNSAVIQRLCLSLLRRWGNRKKKKKKKKKNRKKKKNKKQLFRIPCKRSFHRIPHQFQQAKSACIIDGELSFTKSRGLEGPQRNRMFVVSTAAMCLGNTEILSLFFMATRPKLKIVQWWFSCTRITIFYKAEPLRFGFHW